MNAVATTTIAILRGTTTDDYGDVVDAATEVATGIPASILEQRQNVATPDDPQPRVVRGYTGRVGADVDVQTGDRIKDETTDDIYLVDQCTRSANPVMTPDIRLDLRRTT